MATRSSSRLSAQTSKSKGPQGNKRPAIGKAKATPAKKPKTAPSPRLDPDDSNDSESEVDFAASKTSLSIREMVAQCVAEEIPAAVSNAVKESIPALIESINNKATSDDSSEVSHESQSVASALAEDISGDTDSDGESDKLNDVGLAPDINVSPELKAKCIGDKYYSFGKLLYKEPDDKMLTLKAKASGGSIKSLMVDPNENSVKIRNIGQWDRAFTIHQYMYVEAHPEAALGLIRHGSIIKDMAWRGLCWQQYDENFRRHRSRNPKAYPYGVIVPTLWSTWAIPRAITAAAGTSQVIGNQGYRQQNGYQSNRQQNMNRGNRSNWSQSNNKGRWQQNSFMNNSQVPRNNNGRFGSEGNHFNPGPSAPRSARICFRFNERNVCKKPPCTFKHVCSKCGQANHGAVACNA